MIFEELALRLFYSVNRNDPTPSTTVEPMLVLSLTRNRKIKTFDDDQQCEGTYNPVEAV
jgi:hypothetical protein